MKKISKVLALGLLLTSAAQAYEIFVGAHAHLSHLHSKNDSELNILGHSQNYNNHHSAKRVHPAFSSGVQFHQQQFLIGVEAEWLAPPHAQSGIHHRNGFVYSTHLKTKNAYNAGIKVGYFISPTILPYIKGIYEKRGFTHTIHRDDVGVQQKTEKSFHKSGFGGGIGIEFLLKKNLSTNIEVRGIKFNSIKYTPSLSSQESHKYDIKPAHTTLLVGLKYTLGAL